MAIQMMDDYDILPRIGHFNDLMEPAAHLFPAGFTQDLKANGFFTAPASTKYHGAFEGGLFEHSRNVTQVLVALTKDNGLICKISVANPFRIVKYKCLAHI